MMTTLENFDFEGIIPISDDEFRKISEIVFSRFGINLTDKKKILVQARLSKVIRKMGLSSFDQYYNEVINDKTSKSLLLLIDHITTNYTYFFREKIHFSFFRDNILLTINRMLQSNNEKPALRIWVAGCATGEEAYTLGILLYESFAGRLQNIDIGILATDISLTSLKEAKRGLYSDIKLAELPADFRLKYFDKIAGNQYRIKEKIKKLVLFKRFNLMNKIFPFKRKFHIIFCRNVMIYFRQESRKELIDNFFNSMYPEAYLFIGHSETLGMENAKFRFVKAGIYQKILPIES